MIYQRVVIYRCAYYAMLAVPIIIGISTLLFFSRLLSDVAANAFPISYLGYFLLLTLLKYLPHFLMLSGFIGTFIAFYQFSQQNEMNVWFYAGLGLKNFIKPIMYFALPLTLVITFFSFEISPWAVRNIKTARISSVLNINPQEFVRDQFIAMPDGKHTLFWTTDGNIFIANNSTSANDVILTKHISRKQNESFKLDTGRLYHLNQQSSLFEKITFDSFELALPTNNKINISARGKKITDLDFSSNNDIAEFIWRLNLPIMTLVLLIAALYLSANSRSMSHQKNSSYFFTIILFFFSISQLNLTKDLMEEAKIPLLLGLLAPHCITLGATALIYHYLKKQ